MAKDKKGVSKIAKALKRSPGAISVMAAKRGMSLSMGDKFKTGAGRPTQKPVKAASRLVRAVSKAAQSEQSLNKGTARFGRPFAFH
jgi:hypothetical protein